MLVVAIYVFTRNFKGLKWIFRLAVELHNIHARSLKHKAVILSGTHYSATLVPLFTITILLMSSLYKLKSST